MSFRTVLPSWVSSAPACGWIWVGLCMLLITNVPLFLCLQLNGDAAYYDLQVRCVEAGGVLYRDMVEPNLPGIVWVHMFVRSVIGWSPVALRFFDLLVLSGILGLLVLWNRRTGRGARGWAEPCFAAGMVLFYFSLTAWSHCQRDVWMLLPALGALYLRHRNMLLIREDRSTLRRGLGALLEGALWGCAFWIKPHIAVPATFVLVASLPWCGWRRRTLEDLAGVLVGGMLAGAAGSAWLIGSGAWPHFWEMQLHWNPEYVAARASVNPLRGHYEVLRGLAPWSWAHLVAFPYAIARLIRWPKLPQDLQPLDATADRSESLLCALYVGWVAQTVVLQHPFPYVHVPSVILAAALLARMRWKASGSRAPTIVVASVFGVALFTSPATQFERLMCWPDCVTKGPTLSLRGRLQVESMPYWEYYPEVVDFLRTRGVQGRDVLVYSSNLVSLYSDLPLKPPHRFVLTDAHAAFFASRGTEIREAIRNSPHRYVVSELISSGVTHEELDRNDPETGLPVAFPRTKLRLFPATQPVIFRSGWFVVHEARQPIGPFFDRLVTSD